MRVYIFVVVHLLLLAQVKPFFPDELWHHMETCPKCLNCENFIENDCPGYNAILRLVQQQDEQQAAVQNVQLQPALRQTHQQPRQPYAPPSPPAQNRRTLPARLGLDDADSVPAPEPQTVPAPQPVPVQQLGLPGGRYSGVSNFQPAQPDLVEQDLEKVLATMRERMAQYEPEQRALHLQRQMELVEGQGFPHIQSPRSQQHAYPMPVPSPQRFPVSAPQQLQVPSAQRVPVSAPQWLPAPEHNIGSSGATSSGGWNLEASNQAQLDRELQAFLERMQELFQQEGEPGRRRSNQLMIRELSGPGSNVDESVDASAEPIGYQGEEKRKGKTMQRQDSQKRQRISVKDLAQNPFKADAWTKPIDQHKLTKNRSTCERKRKVEKLCWGCASKGKKKVCTTYCPDCAKEPPLCLDCFNETHNQTETLKPVIAGNIVALGKDRVTGQIDRINKQFPARDPEKPLERHTLETRYNGKGEEINRHCRLCYNIGECTLPEHSHWNKQLMEKKQKIKIWIPTYCPDCVGQPSLCRDCFDKVHHLWIRRN